MNRTLRLIQGSLIGGAIGDALGWPVEFKSYNDIITTYGDKGIIDLELNSENIAEITDDTQMTLFTAEGLLLAKVDEDIVTSVYESYIRWLNTQGYNKEVKPIGWLLQIPKLNNRRAPGNACISSLASSKIGTIENPINNSKGCGGVMRVAPVGLLYPKEDSFEIASKLAAITHGHPSGYLSAGALAYIISIILEGKTIEEAVEDTLLKLQEYKNNKETYNILEKSLELSKQNLSKQNIEDVVAISQLGEGWVGEEALAISVYSALKYKNDFKKGLIASVNHDGDSDSTGAITGNILGAYLGLDNIPKGWIESVELRDVVMDMGRRIYERRI